MDETLDNFLAQARMQALESRRRLIANKDLVPPSVIQEALGQDWATFEEAACNGRILMVEVDEQNYIPAFYLDKSINHSQLEEVIKALGDVDQGLKWQFLTTPKLTLNGATPLEALRSGKLEYVLDAACSFAEL